MRYPITLFLLLLLSFSSILSYAQKLDESKDEIIKGQKSDNTSTSQFSSSGSGSSGSNCDTTQSLGELVFGGIAKGLFYVFKFSVIGSPGFEEHLHNRLSKYPYYNFHSGNYESVDSGVVVKNRARIDLDYQFIYSDKNLTGNRYKCNLRPFQYFYLQAQYHQLSEYNNNNTYSALSLFNFNFCYDRLRFERFNLGWDLGICYISNNVNKGGFSAGLNAEAFVVRPFSIYVSQQWGSINHIAVDQFECSAKYYIKRYSFHLGYEHLKIGNPLYDYVSLGAGICL
jgi:hypothetical protein